MSLSLSFAPFARSIRRLRGINRHKEAKDLFVNHKNYGMTLLGLAI
jgi:hypothetical protein